MEMFSNLAFGLETAVSGTNLLYCFAGVFLGTAIGVLPGLGPVATIAMLLPITFGLDPLPALIMLSGIYYGAQYGGSTTAIMINLPGEANSVVTAIDGYQLARQGKAGLALFTAAVGSFTAGTLAVFLIAGFGPPLAEFALTFGPAEYFALIMLGLAAAIAMAHGSILKAIAMVLLGLLLGTVGTDLYTGISRFTFGQPRLGDGIDFVALSMGVFGISEIIRNLEQEPQRAAPLARLRDLIPTRAEFLSIIAPILRGTTLGSILGILPGGGALLGSFAAYAVEKKLSKTPERFGKGAIEGVAAPESANNAAAQTSFIPMLTLGIPANPVMALMIGALIIQGIQPGPNVMNTNPDLFWGLIASMWVGNLMLLILNLPLIGMWVKLFTVPYWTLYPAIVAVCCIGAYGVENTALGVFTMAAFGVLGYVLVKLDCEPAPLLLGFIIGPLMEEHLRRAMLLSRGDPLVFFEHPTSAVLMGLAIVALGVALVPAIGRKREILRE